MNLINFLNILRPWGLILNLKYPKLKRNIFMILMLTLIITGSLPFFEDRIQGKRLNLDPSAVPEMTNLAVLEENSLFSSSSPNNPDPQVIEKMKVVITAYSSSVWETDDTPYLTAAGTSVREGIVANNLLPFGTKIKIPELYGERVFVVEDRMNWEKGKYHIDIWFPDYWQALNFGAKRTYIEILES